ncbi:MAG TPA: carbohydrate binding family 9 domain-containing protein, partial [Gemmatimonadales bacterium]
MLRHLAMVLPALIDPPQIYHGRAGHLDVRLPRLEAEIEVNGRLTEEVWSQAAVLTGFSQFSPSDGVPAADSTDVLVWYSPTAIHFGIRAWEAHGAVHATLADRDRIGADDHVQILLSTFNDGRQATVFAVNPYGVQSDGALVETGSTSGNGFNNAVVRRENADLSPDYIFQSKGVVTERGYVVEIRIPFKSLRFQSAPEQSWGIHVTRQVQHSGYEDSWAPARRSSASFLAQAGRLVGLTDLRRGLVLDMNPSVTSRTTGQRNGSGWEYVGGSPEVGGT